MAARTGLGVATLRAWESRYGFPEPERLPNGHRRYRIADVARIEQVARYPKVELPDEVWARSGAPRLVLITCGGDFDTATRHYEDNVVAWASPA